MHLSSGGRSRTAALCGRLRYCSFPPSLRDPLIWVCLYLFQRESRYPRSRKFSSLGTSWRRSSINRESLSLLTIFNALLENIKSLQKSCLKEIKCSFNGTLKVQNDISPSKESSFYIYLHTSSKLHFEIIEKNILPLLFKKKYPS